MKHIYAIVIIFLLCTRLFAQHFPYRHYTTADGLINSSVYVCYQDHQGFMWFGTENGVSRFDGNTFKNYTIADGLPGNMVMSIAEDEKGQLYFGTRSQGIGKLVNYNIQKVFNDSLGLLFNNEMVVMNNKVFSIRNGWGLLIADLQTNKIKFFNGKTFKNRFFLYLKKTHDGNVLIGSTAGILKYANDTILEMNIPGIADKMITYIHQSADTIWLGSKGKLYKMVNYSIQDSIIIPSEKDGSVSAFITDRRGYYWFTVDASKLYCMINHHIIDVNAVLNVKNISYNQLREDNDGNIWISTVNDGLYCINYFYINKNTADFRFKNNYITTLNRLDDDNILVGTSDGLYNINIALKKASMLLPSSPSAHAYYIKNIDVENPSEIIVAETAEGKQRSYVNRKIGGRSFLLCVSCSNIKENDSIYLSGNWSGGLAVFNAKTGIWASDIWIAGFNIYTGIRTNSIYKSNDGPIWVGTSKGLFELDKGHNAKKINYEFLKTPVNTITKANNGDIWFCTDQGIAIYSHNKWQYITEMNGVRISSVTSVTFDNDNRAWIGTMTGIYMMGKNTLRQLDLNSGLPSNQINALLYDKYRNQLIIGTANGIATLDITAYSKVLFNPPLVIITDVSSMQNTYAAFDNLKFASTERTLTIDFTAVSLSLAKQLLFQYSLDGNTWANVSGNNRSIQFVDLDYGTHKLLLRCGFGNVEWSKPTELGFAIHVPYWATLWFKVAIFLLSISVIVSIAWWRVNAIRGTARERLDFNDRINELRHQALAASMNPHFVFNSLNSIQHFINSREPHEASDYLGRFSRLIRQTVNLSTESNITLDEEIQRLHGYLDLEQLRLGESLSYEIILDDKINAKEIQIPNMVIQPFVENAIWHGIMPARRNGKVTIGIYDDNTHIRVEITDDGVGFKKSTKKTNHISKGMQIVRERLKPIDGSDPITIEDLTDNNMPGTRVTIRFAKVTKHVA